LTKQELLWGLKFQALGSSSNIVKDEVLKAKKKKNINTSQPLAESGAVSQQQEQTTHAIP
jgi:hypothetical protein